MRISQVFALVAAASAVFAQDAKPHFGNSVLSPEVHADHSVTFRCKAPNALKVSVAGEDLQKLELTKDENGIWLGTTSPLKPDYYCYWFSVDGIALSDTANPEMKPVAVGGAESILHVPGDPHANWEPANVPHGLVTRVRYYSVNFREDRDFYVYTPAGYEASRGRYPVLYLLHGVMETETAWETAGRASVILDNLVARRNAKPMILVMPNGYGFKDVAENMGLQFGGPEGQHRVMDAFSRELLTQIEPRVRRLYRTNGVEAIAGASMGGAQALSIGLTHPEKFAFIGAFAPAVIMYGKNLDGWIPRAPARARLDVYCGRQDFLINAVRKSEGELKQKGFPVSGHEMDGGHTWNVWRRTLADFAQKIFR